MTLTVGPTQISITSSDHEPLIAFLKAHSYSQAILLSDETIFALHGASLKHNLASLLPTNSILIAPGEIAKTIKTATYCWEQMLAYGTDRKSVLIALGGGVATDIAGFVAGCYMRGIDVIDIPTTLLGMVDGSIGGKCGVNFPKGKNLIGVFHHPKLVHICTQYLETLPQREFCSGLAEVIKYGVIADPALFNLLESSMKPILNHDPKLITEIIVRSCTIKGQIVQADERDQQHRANLNWGHTFGHAIESVTQYQRFLHGEAVSIGMNCAAHVSHALGLVHHDFINRQADLLMLAELPIALPKNISINEIIDLMKSDKKSTHGKISLIVARNFGDVFKMDRVDEGVIREVLNKILKEEGESR